MNPESPHDQDPLRARLHDAAAHIESNPLTGRVDQMTSRVRGRRMRSTLAAAAVVAVAAAGVGIALSMQSPSVTPPAHSPTDTSVVTPSPSTDPSTDPTESETDPAAQPAPAVWSTPVTPACGDVLPPSTLDAQVVFADPPAEVTAEDSFPVTVDNPNDWDLATTVDRYDFAVPVLLDPQTSTVVGLTDPEPVLAEGFSALALNGGDSIGASGTLRWAQMCDDPGDEHGTFEPVPEGDYLLYLIAATDVVGPDPASANQIQGGPFPVTVNTSAHTPVPEPVLEGISGVGECGSEWGHDGPQLPAQIDPGGLDAATSSWTVTFAEPVAALSAYPQIHILDEDNNVVGPQAGGHDVTLGIYASADAPVEIEAAIDATDCAGEALPGGAYQVILTLNEVSDETNIVGVSEPVSFTVD